MTVNSTVSFTNRHHEFAMKKVQDGSYASVSSLAADGIERLMQEEEERKDLVAGMAGLIKARMETPRPRFVEMDDSDTMFDDLRRRLK